MSLRTSGFFKVSGKADIVIIGKKYQYNNMCEFYW